MAGNKSGQKSRAGNSMMTKNGNPRLGPLNISQLEKMLTNARKKHVMKIQRRIAYLKSLPSYKAPVVEVIVEEVVESAV
ncbi:MAG: hypothetical protein WCK68_12325 [Betaproteobacteria bacterium]